MLDCQVLTIIIITVFDSISTCLRQNEKKKKKKRGLALQSKQNLRIPTDLQKHGKTSKYKSLKLFLFLNNHIL
jgi:hypothetical protein